VRKGSSKEILVQNKSNKEAFKLFVSLLDKKAKKIKKLEQEYLNLATHVE
jgi:hypothetical protein